MPKRTNDFQQLVYLIEQNLAADAKETESKMLRDLVTGAEREVDVCIEKPIGGHSVTISVESRDRKRPADVRWVEEMISKHQRLPTNVLALVSSSGFSQEARKVAKAYGIETVSLEEVSASFATRIVGKLSSFWCKTVILAPTRCSVRVEALEGLPSETVRAFPDNLLFAADGSEIGILRSYVDFALTTSDVITRFLSLGTESHEWFEVAFTPPLVGAPSDGQHMCLRKEVPTALRAIEWIKVVGMCRFTVSEFPLKSGALNDVQVAWGAGKIWGRDSLLVVSEHEDAKPKYSFTIRP